MRDGNGFWSRRTSAPLAVLAAIGLFAASVPANVASAQSAERGGTPTPARTATHSVKPHVGGSGIVTHDLTTPGVTALSMAQALVGNNVTVSNAHFTGANVAGGTFTGGAAPIGFDSGIILSSGTLSNVVGPNTSPNTSADNGTPGDPDLNVIVAPHQTFDAAVLEFDFVPTQSTVSFQYVFGSEEYPEFVGTQFNDVFAFYLNGQNIALVPGTLTPVTINDINNGNPTDGTPATNPQYFRDNTTGTINTELDGLTVVLTAHGSVNAGHLNHIKLAIADTSDGIYDSDVFLQGGSFVSAPGGLVQNLPSPSRIVDTRNSTGPITTGQSHCFTVSPSGSIPANAAAVVLNVTAVGYTAPGWLTVYPAGQPVPTTSTLNFDTSEYAMANNTIVRVGDAGQVCVFVGTVNGIPSNSQVILDATGYLPAGGLANMPMLASPQRVVDTRNPTGGGPIATGTSRCFQIGGIQGIPSNAVAVILDVAAVGYGTRGWLTIYPSGTPVPATSTLNFDTSEYAMANGAIVRLGSDGQICVNVGTVNSAPGGSQVVIDATGYLTIAGITQVPMLASPVRIADTRTSGGAIPTGSTRCFTVIGGAAGIPANAIAIVMNVTAVDYTTQGWLTVFPNGELIPSTSTLNFDPHEYAMANGTIMGIGQSGQVCVNVGTVGSASGSSDVILDAVGYMIP